MAANVSRPLNVSYRPGGALDAVPPFTRTHERVRETSAKRLIPADVTFSRRIVRLVVTPSRAYNENAYRIVITRGPSSRRERLPDRRHARIVVTRGSSSRADRFEGKQAAPV